MKEQDKPRGCCMKTWVHGRGGGGRRMMHLCICAFLLSIFVKEIEILNELFK